MGSIDDSTPASRGKLSGSHSAYSCRSGCCSYSITITFLVLLATPIIVKLYLIGTDFSHTLLVFTCLFFVFLLISAKQFNQLFLSQLQTSINNNINHKALEDLRFAINRHAIVSISDVQGNITYANDNFNDISQYSAEELMGKNHNILNSGYHPDSFFKEMWQSIQRGHIWRGEIRNKAKDGSFYWVISTIIPYLNALGEPEQFIAIRNNITELKTLSSRKA